MYLYTDYELTKTDTKMIKGLAIFAMVFLHLFDTLDYQDKFIPLIYIKGYPLVFYFAQLSDFCVMAFAFCSGYAHMSQYGKQNYYKRRLIGLLGVYVNFWIVLFLFSIISILLGNGEQIPGSFSTFIGNFTTIYLSYNGSWWYLLTYAFIVLSSPVLLRLSRSSGIWKDVLVLVFIICIYSGAYYERFIMCSSNWFLYQLGLYGMTLAEYMMGSLAYEHKIFGRMIKIWNSIFHNTLVDCLVSVTLFVILLWFRTLIIPSVFVAPVSGVIVLFLFQKVKKPVWIEKCMLILGKHSTNIWLTHMFFYLYIFINLVYKVKYPVLIMLFMLGITIGVSMIINLIYRYIWVMVKDRLFGNL